MHIVVRETKPLDSDFTKMTFCQHWNNNHMAHILSNSRSARPIRIPLKASTMLQNIVSTPDTIIWVKSGDHSIAFLPR